MKHPSIAGESENFNIQCGNQYELFIRNLEIDLPQDFVTPFMGLISNGVSFS